MKFNRVDTFELLKMTKKTPVVSINENRLAYDTIPHGKKWKNICVRCMSKCIKYILPKIYFSDFLTTKSCIFRI